MGMSKIQHKDSRWLIFQGSSMDHSDASPLPLLMMMSSFVLFTIKRISALGRSTSKEEDEEEEDEARRLLTRSTAAPAAATTSEATSEAFVHCGSWSVRFPTPNSASRSDSGTRRHRLHSPDLHGGSGPSRQPPRHKAKKGEIEDATGLTQIVNQSGSASGRMDGHVAELSGA
ncbi:unnamed protein product [Microthlaspi erraticum]|uniref:Uncharacterized protein n=1 Tax=Microthlaspi erraticum TaxID=1685480 RepID=A0A6D2HZ77_9BRAS|nr:unnamed protein product [Microthlaspi erraticum]